MHFRSISPSDSGSDDSVSSFSRVFSPHKSSSCIPNSVASFFSFHLQSREFPNPGGLSLLGNTTLLDSVVRRQCRLSDWRTYRPLMSSSQQPDSLNFVFHRYGQRSPPFRAPAQHRRIPSLRLPHSSIFFLLARTRISFSLVI